MAEKKTKVHVKVHVNNNVNLSFKERSNLFKKLFSDPKLYKATKLIDGEKVLTIEKPWHIYYYYRNPETGLMEKFIEKNGLNSFKTVKARLAAGKNLCEALKRYLQDGHNPFEKRRLKADVNSIKYTTIEALDIAFNQKKNSWKQSTKDVNLVYLESFKKWITNKKLDKEPIEYLTRKHISFYLGYLVEKKNISNTSRNNHKRLLSSLFTELEEKEIIKNNFIIKIASLKAAPKKNKPFTITEIDNIFKYCKEHQPYLYQFLKVMWYTFLRPVEITRLKVKNINLIDNIIDVESKTEAREYIRIVTPLQLYFNSLVFHNFEKEMFVFGKDHSVGYWETIKEKSREDFFIRRFKKVKDHFGFSSDYGIYSLRHTAALSQYSYSKNKLGLSDYESTLKLQEIMRHSDEKTTRKYLRNIGGYLAADWSNNYEYEVI